MTATLMPVREAAAAPRAPFSRDSQTYNQAATIPATAASWWFAAESVLEQRALGHTSTSIIHTERHKFFETRTSPVLTHVVPLDQVNEAVIARFAAVPQVGHIFCDLFQGAPVFTLLVKGDHYDDAIMDQLLDVELALHLQFAPSSLTFNYMPQPVGTDPRQTVRATAQRLFERKHGRAD